MTLANEQKPPADEGRLEPGVGRLVPERADACENGCNGCDECTDYYCGDEYGDEPHGPPDFGCCLPPGECCMPGLHFQSECHSAAMYELAHGGAHIGAGPRKTPNVELSGGRRPSA